jgi:hypothetical protein
MGRRRSDRELAATKYAGRESASERTARRQRERGSMGRGHHTVAGAAAAGERWEESDRRRFGKNPFYRR